LLTVLKVDGDKITVDGNHPLAGQTLNFHVEIVECREPTKEELDAVASDDDFSGDDGCGGSCNGCGSSCVN
jgi:FKBP-type peptidyl-prolyl cis-trans isomerase SlyD